MSKYLKHSSTARYTSSENFSHSKYARATRIQHDRNRGSDATASTDEVQQSIQSVNAVQYTEYDQQQFTALSNFPNRTNHRKLTEHKAWASCQFTDQDDAGFKQLQHELSAVAQSSL